MCGEMKPRILIPLKKSKISKSGRFIQVQDHANLYLYFCKVEGIKTKTQKKRKTERERERELYWGDKVSHEMRADKRRLGQSDERSTDTAADSATKTHTYTQILFTLSFCHTRTKQQRRVQSEE